MARVHVNTIKDRIKRLLLKKEHLRNDDGRLICSIWWQDLKKLNLDPDKISATELMNLFINNKITHSESIRRDRAKLQSEFPELRGQLYQERLNKQSKIRTDLGYNN